MKFLFSILLLLGSAFSALAFPSGDMPTLPAGNVSALGDVNIAAGTDYDWDTFHYHGYSTAEVWIGRAAVNVGDLTGNDLYNHMHDGIGKDCDSARKFCDFKGRWNVVNTHRVRNWNKGEIENSYFSWIAEGRWETENHRRVMISAVARAMCKFGKTPLFRVSLTNNYVTAQLTIHGEENCYLVVGHGKFCNMGDFIRINLPGDNHMWLKLWSPGQVTSVFKCCPSRYLVDRGLDGDGHNFELATGHPFSRTVWCLIDHQKTCGECGEKCDSCGIDCPNVCPGGRC
jgi:hypothetical protein